MSEYPSPPGSTTQSALQGGMAEPGGSAMGPGELVRITVGVGDSGGEPKEAYSHQDHRVRPGRSLGQLLLNHLSP